jgi:HEPN domain-containing protein
LSNKAIAKVLAGKAHSNANAARLMKDIPSRQIGDEVFANNVQQAVEKWLKAMIAWKGHKYPVTHDIGELLEAVEKAGLTKPAAVDADLAETLTDYAEKERYEAVRRGPPLDREALVGLLEAVGSWADNVGVR